MSRVETVHRKEDGEQVTLRVVVLEDATGATTRYRFRETDDGHEYVDDGEPTQRALEALEEHLDDD